MSYNKELSSNPKKWNRKPPAVRRSGVARGGEKKDSGLRINGRDVVLVAAFFVALGCGWGLLSLIQPEDTRVPWAACLEDQQDGGMYPTLVEIPAGTYEIPKEAGILPVLASLFKEPDIVLENGFFVQHREVDLDQFKKYVEEIDRTQDFAERERLRLRIGSHWNYNDAQDSLVRHVSWEGAWDYAQWLSKKTGCDYKLPSREEWAAAAIFLAKQGVVKSSVSVNADGVLKSLLWGAAEWSRSSCPGGYFLLGENDWMAPADEQREVCMPAILSMAGFRLVLDPASVSKEPGGKKSSGSLKMDDDLSVERVKNLLPPDAVEDPSPPDGANAPQSTNSP